MNFWRRIIDLYVDGFKNMTWGKELWFLIFLKIFILFVILRLFFFRPAMSGLTYKQKSEVVSGVLTKKTPPNVAIQKQKDNKIE